MVNKLNTSRWISDRNWRGIINGGNISFLSLVETFEQRLIFLEIFYSNVTEVGRTKSPIYFATCYSHTIHFLVYFGLYDNRIFRPFSLPSHIILNKKKQKKIIACNKKSKILHFNDSTIHPNTI